MPRPPAATHRLARTIALACLVATACADPLASGAPTDPLARDAGGTPTGAPVAVVTCVAMPHGRTVRCGDAAPGAGDAADIIGGQNTLVQLVSSNPNYDGTTFATDVTIRNLMNEAIGTPDGTVRDTAGIRIFFASLPVVTGGTGTVTVANPDGVDAFTASNQPYFRYDQILAKDATSSVSRWQFTMPPTVTAFTFQVYVSAMVQPLIVINELLANPGGTITDASGEWVELYNAGTRAVDLQTLVFADSAASGRRPYWQPTQPVVVAPGGYVVLGNTTNTTSNGGVPVDYAYGALSTFANSLDAFKVSRAYGTDTLTIDYVRYASAGISAQNGVSRELQNPALDNTDMDGSNWADALVTAVYGPGGRGTPKAQNSAYTP